MTKALGMVLTIISFSSISSQVSQPELRLSIRWTLSTIGIKSILPDKGKQAIFSFFTVFPVSR